MPKHDKDAVERCEIELVPKGNAVYRLAVRTSYRTTREKWILAAHRGIPFEIQAEDGTMVTVNSREVRKLTSYE